jgi:hypothetical protein
MVTEGVREWSTVPFVELTMAGPVGAVGGAEGLPFTGDCEFECACWLAAKPPTTAGEPPGCVPFVAAFAYEERALLDVVPGAAAADGEADLAMGALMGVEVVGAVLVIRKLSDRARRATCREGV